MQPVDAIGCSLVFELILLLLVPFSLIQPLFAILFSVLPKYSPPALPLLFPYVLQFLVSSALLPPFLFLGFLSSYYISLGIVLDVVVLMYLKYPTSYIIITVFSKRTIFALAWLRLCFFNLLNSNLDRSCSLNNLLASAFFLASSSLCRRLYICRFIILLLSFVAFLNYVLESSLFHRLSFLSLRSFSMPILNSQRAPFALHS